MEDVIAIIRQTSLQYGQRCRRLEPPVVSPVTCVSIVVLSVVDDILAGKDVETPESDALDVMSSVISSLSVEIGMCFVDETSDVLDTFTDELSSDTGVDDDVGVTAVVDILVTLVISFVVKTLVVCVVEVVLIVEVVVVEEVVVVGSCILQRFAIAL